MFVLGVFQAVAGAPSALVLLEQTFKNLRRHYRIEALAEVLPELRREALAVRVSEIFKDRRYACTKRVFSQDRRPAKDVKVMPRIVLAPAADSSEAADYLRARKLPVTCVICRELAHWQKLDYHRICLGHNYLVSPGALADCLATVAAENRLGLPAGGLATGAQVASLRAAVPHGSGWPPCGTALALAAAVWVGETLKSVKRYGQTG